VDCPAPAVRPCSAQGHATYRNEANAACWALVACGRPLQREISVSNAILSPAASDAQKGFNQQTVGRISQD